jgi:hypothetical protein
VQPYHKRKQTNEGYKETHWWVTLIEKSSQYWQRTACLLVDIW